MFFRNQKRLSERKVVFDCVSFAQRKITMPEELCIPSYFFIANFF